MRRLSDRQLSGRELNPAKACSPQLASASDALQAIP